MYTPGLPDGMFSNPKIQILVYFGEPWNGKCWYSYGHLEYLTSIWYMYIVAIWYILWSFGIYFTVLVCCTQKNLATLVDTVYLYL
jgi:hypothetical protein